MALTEFMTRGLSFFEFESDSLTMLTLKKAVPSFSVRNTSSCSATGELAADVVLEVENVFFGYDSPDLLRGVSLAVRQGEAVAVMGRSGAGKSTLLKICAGLLKPRSGVVKVLGREMGNRCFESARPRITYIPLTLGLVSGASALYFVLLGRDSRRPLMFVAGLWSMRDV
jgi:ABC-type cobalamin/Fe3+-siderophores transport systems, ATPase components